MIFLFSLIKSQLQSLVSLVYLLKKGVHIWSHNTTPVLYTIQLDFSLLCLSSQAHTFMLVHICPCEWCNHSWKPFVQRDVFATLATRGHNGYLFQNTKCLALVSARRDGGKSSTCLWKQGELTYLCSVNASDNCSVKVGYRDLTAYTSPLLHGMLGIWWMGLPAIIPYKNQVQPPLFLAKTVVQGEGGVQPSFSQHFLSLKTPLGCCNLLSWGGLQLTDIQIEWPTSRWPGQNWPDPHKGSLFSQVTPKDTLRSSHHNLHTPKRNILLLVSLFRLSL